MFKFSNYTVSSDKKKKVILIKSQYFFDTQYLSNSKLRIFFRADGFCNQLNSFAVLFTLFLKNAIKSFVFLSLQYYVVCVYIDIYARPSSKDPFRVRETL